MNKKILIINGPNLNLLGEREQSQYGKNTLKDIENKCVVNKIQQVRNEFNGVIINAAGFTHTSVSIRDALEILKIPIIEVHISNIYKREEFRRKSLLSGVVTGGIFGLGTECYILAIKALQSLMKNGNW